MRIKLLYLRKSRGLLQRDVANAIGISVPCYSRYEREEREADYTMLTKFASFFGISIDYLLGKEDEQQLFDNSKILISPMQNFFKTLPEDKQLNYYDVICMYDRLTAHQQKLSIAYMQFFDDSNAETDTIRRVQQGREAQHIGSR